MLVRQLHPASGLLLISLLLARQLRPQRRQLGRLRSQQLLLLLQLLLLPSDGVLRLCQLHLLLRLCHLAHGSTMINSHSTRPVVPPDIVYDLLPNGPHLQQTIHADTGAAHSTQSICTW